MARLIDQMVTDAVVNHERFAGQDRVVEHQRGPERDTVQVKLYGTLVLEADEKRDYLMIDAGGYNTHTTLRTINAALLPYGLRIWVRHSQWYLAKPNAPAADLRLLLPTRNELVLSEVQRDGS